MKKSIIVSSTNPVKLESVRVGFGRIFVHEGFTVEGCQVQSGVSNQPLSDEETLQGARNRVIAAMREKPNADYWVGIEGGIASIAGDLAAFAWIVVRSPTLTGKSRTGTFVLPEPVSILIQQGKELGEADDLVFQKQNSKQANGAIGLLTNGVIDRTTLYAEAVVLALVPFVNPGMYPADADC